MPAHTAAALAGGDPAMIETYGESGLLNGEETIGEAVRGGTIAQNRPDPA